MSEYKCPDCDSTEVTLTHEQMFMANTGEHYCHSVKIQDPDSKAQCLTCGWMGFHDDLKGYKE
jgi:hypothetical protein